MEDGLLARYRATARVAPTIRRRLFDWACIVGGTPAVALETMLALLNSNPLLLCRHHSRLRSIIHVQLLHNMADVRFDGFDAHREFYCDHAIGRAIDE